MLKLRITAIRHETPDTVTIELEPVDGAPIRYEAGQFITLIFDSVTKELRRSYSFSSTPGIDAVMMITVRRVVNGAISRWLAEKARVGDVLNATSPAGRFRIDTLPHAKRQIWMIAAGSGIVPIYSLLKKILKEEPRSEIVLVYQNRNVHNIIFKKELEALQKEYAGTIRYLLLLSAAPHGQESRRLTNNSFDLILKKWLSPQKESLFFICGPAAFMRMAQFTLRVNGIENEQIRKENFTIDFIPPAPFIDDTSPKHVVLHMGNHTYQFPVVYPKNILQAALDHDVPMPYSCRGGRCSSCVAICLRGNVKMSINEVLTDADLAAGMILTCVGFATGNLELKIQN